MTALHVLPQPAAARLHGPLRLKMSLSGEKLILNPDGGTCLWSAGLSMGSASRGCWLRSRGSLSLASGRAPGTYGAERLSSVPGEGLSLHSWASGVRRFPLGNCLQFRRGACRARADQPHWVCLRAEQAAGPPGELPAGNWLQVRIRKGRDRGWKPGGSWGVGSAWPHKEHE